LQGASATEDILRGFAGKPVRAFVVWEPVLLSDWSAPSPATLGRISDTRAIEFWDKDRLISHTLGEHDRKSVVWDQIMIYGAGAVWKAGPPEPLYQGRPVVKVVAEARAALARALEAR
jgi:hypothetical protein